MRKYADKRLRWALGKDWVHFQHFYSLHVLLGSVWAFSRSSSFLLQSKRIHVRLTGECVSERAACDGAETSPG